MEQHVRILSILDFISGGLSIFGGIIFGVIMIIGAGAATEIPRGAGGLAALYGSIGVIGSILIIGVGVFEIFVGLNLQQFKSWARIAQIVLGALSIASFPLGTAFGVYSLWVMLNEETMNLFKQPPGSSEQEKPRIAA